MTRPMGARTQGRRVMQVPYRELQFVSLVLFVSLYNITRKVFVPITSSGFGEDMAKCARKNLLPSVGQTRVPSAQVKVFNIYFGVVVSCCIFCLYNSSL